MNTDDFWGDKVKYVERLAGEVADLKGVLQDITQQVRRIERRIDYVLPKGEQAKTRKVAAGNSVKKTSAMSRTEARQVIKRIEKHLCDEKPVEDIQSELRNMNVKRELTPIAREFGMTHAPLPPKTELVLDIITRLRQNVILTENIRKMPRVAEKEKHFGS